MIRRWQFLRQMSRLMRLGDQGVGQETSIHMKKRLATRLWVG